MSAGLLFFLTPTFRRPNRITNQLPMSPDATMVAAKTGRGSVPNITNTVLVAMASHMMIRVQTTTFRGIREP